MVVALVSCICTLCGWCWWSFWWFGLGYLVAIGLFFDLVLGLLFGLTCLVCYELFVARFWIGGSCFVIGLGFVWFVFTVV